MYKRQGQGDINFEEARKQHESYVRLLRNIGIDVIELPPDEALPECVFVEDTAVICNGTALITRPGNPARIKEVKLQLCRKYGVVNVDTCTGHSIRLERCG